MKKENRHNIFILLITISALVMPFLLYSNLFISDKIFLSGDGIQYLSPIIFEKEALFNGEFPFWNHFIENGTPFIADISMAPLYFPTIILSFLPMKWFVFIVYGFHVAFAGIFSFKYFRKIGCMDKIAFLGAVLYMFSIHFGGLRKEHMIIITAVSYFPAAIYYIENYFISGNKTNVFLCTMFLAVQFLGPFVQASAYTFCVVTLYFFIRTCFSKHMVWHNVKLWVISSMFYIGMIALQLLPTIEMISTYKNVGTIPTTIEYFKSYSISFDKLIMMVFPKWFNGNVYFAGGAFKSSGMDIELFFGVCVFALISFALIHYYKNVYIKIFSFMMLFAFVYAAHANIPYLSNVLFLIPGINGFRCPARILFVFIFFAYAVFSYGLNRCIAEKDIYHLYKHAILIFIIMLVSSCLRSAFLAGQSFTNSVAVFYKLFGPELLAMAIFIIVLLILKQKQFINDNIILVTILVISLAEVFPYHYVHLEMGVNDIEISNSTYSEIKKAVSDNKIWDAFQGLDGAHKSLISQNQSMIKGIPSINAYIPFNNPNLCKMFSAGNIANFNYSGLTTGSIYAYTNIHMQNSMLSMLGIKYIIDSSKVIEKGNFVDKIIGTRENVIAISKNINVKAGKETRVVNLPVVLKQNTVYRVSFDYDLIKYPEAFAVDFYGGANYDYDESQFNAYEGIGQRHVVRYINSYRLPANVKTYVRIITKSDQPITVKNFKVDECLVERKENFYEFYKFMNGTAIYYNPAYKNILYTVPNIEGINDKKLLYSDFEKYNFSTTSYVNDDVMPMRNNAAHIQISSFTNNGITANVTSESVCFVNFSQNYYPGWHAYVNGKEEKIYSVNGIIQGVYLPAGNNTLEFKYKSTYFRIGLLISFISLFMVLTYIVKTKRGET